MAKIQIPFLKGISKRYGALEANTGVPTVNLEEGVSLVHDVGRDLAISEGIPFWFTGSHAHVAAGTLLTTFDPAGDLNVVNQPVLGLKARWDPLVSDLWLLGVGAATTAVAGLTLTDAFMIYDPGNLAPALSAQTNVPTGELLASFDNNSLPITPGGGATLFEESRPIGLRFPYKIDPASSGRLLFISRVGGAGTMTIGFSYKAWIGPRNVLPPFA